MFSPGLNMPPLNGIRDILATHPTELNAHESHQKEEPQVNG